MSTTSLTTTSSSCKPANTTEVRSGMAARHPLRIPQRARDPMSRCGPATGGSQAFNLAEVPAPSFNHHRFNNGVLLPTYQARLLFPLWVAWPVLDHPVVADPARLAR